MPNTTNLFRFGKRTARLLLARVRKKGFTRVNARFSRSLLLARSWPSLLALAHGVNSSEPGPQSRGLLERCLKREPPHVMFTLQFGAPVLPVPDEQ